MSFDSEESEVSDDAAQDSFVRRLDRDAPVVRLLAGLPFPWCEAHGSVAQGDPSEIAEPVILAGCGRMVHPDTSQIASRKQPFCRRPVFVRGSMPEPTMACRGKD